MSKDSKPNPFAGNPQSHPGDEKPDKAATGKASNPQTHPGDEKPEKGDEKSAKGKAKS